MSASQGNPPPPLGALLPPLVDSDSHDKQGVLECLLPDQLPDVRGMTDNVFFFMHKHSYIEESEAASALESAMAVKLYQYLLHQGYHSSDLLIVTTSQCQAKRLYELSNRFSCVPTVRLISSTEIDYNADQCKIVILTTLVTQPLETFVQHTKAALRTASIIATHGLFIFGNIEELCEHSSLWQSVAASLEITASLGTHLTLQCENHPQQNDTIHSPRDWEAVALGGCTRQCALTLPCGHRCVRTCHSARLDCAPCRRQTLKALPCGHRKMSACDEPPAPCCVTTTLILPICGHRVVRTCSKPVSDCTASCQRALPCGHRCPRPCHVNDDPQHLIYKCKEPCTRRKSGCTAVSSHFCERLCHEPCTPCTVPVVKARRECTHTSRVPCNASADSVPCHRTCKRVLDCKHHLCLKKCFEECGPCVKKVTLSVCGHETSVPCLSQPPWSCTAACTRALPCGHACDRACGVSCTALCVHPVTVPVVADCGHHVRPPCHVYKNTSFKVSLLSQYCTQRCGVELACGHQCNGTCADCHQGRVHRACAEPCGRTNVCGHVCGWTCSASCPPCSAPCTLRCEHAVCTLPCGAPCRIDCQQPCARSCPHVSCNSPCGAACSSACSRACARRLPCGHACRGLCGARCPDVCKVCHPETFPKDAIMMDEYEDDVRFVVLEDCGHIESVDNMDRLVNAVATDSVIRVPSCHVCRAPILNTPRYRHVLTRVWPAVQAAKEQIHGTQSQIHQRKEQLMPLQLQVSTVFQQGNAITENTYWTTALHRVKIETQKKHISLPQLEMLIQSYTILLNIAKYYAEFNQSTQWKMALKDEVTELIVMLCRVLGDNVKRLNEQIQMDIGNELKRMNVMVQLGKILNHSAYEALKATGKVIAATDEARQTVLTLRRYDATKGQTALERLQLLVQITVSKEERDLVVRAIGAKKGSWYRCPNGHVYNIGECGRPDQVSVCPDCKATVGGVSHDLQPGNTHAPDVD